MVPRALAGRVVAAVVARGLVKRYGNVEAVRGIDLDVPTGVTFGFLGPNGAGKSSTMRMLYGLSPATAGELRVLGLDVASRSRELKRRLGVVPQEANLDTDMTAFETLVSFARFFDVTGAAGRAKARELLDAFALAEKAHARVSELSGGMKRRLLIARALVNDPELLVLDEPTVGLDPQSRALLWARIRDFRRSGRTVLLTTHYMEEAEKLCDDLVLMDGGRIVERGAPRALVLKHVGREVLELDLERPEDEARVLAIGGLVRGVDRLGAELLLYSDDGERLLEAVIASGVVARRAALRRATLEDLFLKMTGRRLVD